MKYMKVWQILGLAFGTLILLIAVLGGISASRLSKLNNEVESVTTDRVPKLVMLDKWMVALLQTSRHMRNILIYDKDKIPAEVAAIHSNAATMQEAFEYFSKRATSESSRQTMSTLAGIRDRFGAAEKELLKLTEEQNMTAVRSVLIEKTRPLQLEYIDSLQKLIDHQVEGTNKNAQEAASTYQQGITAIVICSLIAVLFGAALATLITRHLMRQLGGEPVYAADVVRTIASGDLTHSISTRHGDQSSLLFAMQQMQGALRSLISQTHDAADLLATSSHSLASASRQVAEGSNQQSDSASTMAAAVEELTVSISHVADSARTANVMATEAGQLSQKGATLVQNTVGEINKIAGSVERSAQEVQHLGEQSEKISGIVNVIKEIADQTNLLALNAAIEAARAGEQGRGFAVVADEVRKLAERTTASTQEIAGMIGAIQQGTTTAVSGMEDGRSQVREGVAMAEKSGQSMRSIESGSHKLLEAVEEISTALTEQSSASNQIALNVEHIARMTEENSAAINQVSNSASELVRLADQLKTNVSRFRI
jgi:methyl-accepting chemotaxis protein